MPAGAGEGEDEEEEWFWHPWEDEPADALGGLGAVLRAGGISDRDAAPPDATALLGSLAARAAHSLGSMPNWTPAVAEGLRARLALREAAGWLVHQHGSWVHPIDFGCGRLG